MRQNLCTVSSLGKFIVSLPQNKTLQDTSIWTSSVGFRSADGSTDTQVNDTTKGTGRGEDLEVSVDAFWDNPAGNPTPDPDPSLDPYTTPWRKLTRRGATIRVARPPSSQRTDLHVRDNSPAAEANPTTTPSENTPTTDAILWYEKPIHYEVTKTGYYCIGTFKLRQSFHNIAYNRAITGVIPVTVLHQGDSNSNVNGTHTHASFSGVVLFKNAFEGYLPATDYPKITVSNLSYNYACQSL